MTNLMTDPVLTFISHDDFVADIRAIAWAIAAGDWLPDFLIGIGRGGLVPGAYLSHAIGVTMLSVDHSSKVYGFGDQLLAELAYKTRDGHKLLIVEDINDTGSTISYLRDVIDGAGGIAEHVRFAVLINNIRSMAPIDYRGREIDRHATKDWFVFPWEAMAGRLSIQDVAAEVPARTT